MKTFYNLLLGFGTLFINVSCDNRNVIAFIKDFLLKQESPTAVNALLCWNQAQKVKLLKALYGNNVYTSMPKFEPESLYHRSPQEHQLFLTDLRCAGVAEILMKAEELNLFSHPYRWIVLKGKSINADVTLTNLSLTTDSKFFLTDSLDSSTFCIRALYKIQKTSKFFFDDIAKWSSVSGFEYFNKLIIPRQRGNLMGLALNVSYVITDMDSLNHLSDYVNPHIDPVTKLNYIFVQHLLEMMNATGEIKVQTTWGYRINSTSQFSGMIGDLQKGDAEIGGSPAFFAIERIPIIEYVAPTVPTEAKFIFRAPPLTYVTNIFTLPFDRPVWIFCLLLVALTSFILYIIIIWEWKKPEFVPLEDAEDLQITRLQPNIFDAVMIQIGGICQQGYEDEPRSAAGRIAFIFSFIVLMFLYTSFSANIVALLQSTSDSIRTLEDLLNSRLQLGVHDQPYNHHYFSIETEPIRKAIYQQKVAPKGQQPNFMTVEKGIAKMRNEFFAFHVERGAGYKVIKDTFYEHEKCGLTEIGYLQVTYPWLPIRKNSSYLEIIKIGLKKIHESGVQSREVQKFIQRKPPCEGKGSNFMSVGLIDCYYGFLIFGIGAGCACSLLVLEIIIKKILVRRQSHGMFRN